MDAARRLRREVAIATGTLAELYRGVAQTADPDDLARLAGPYWTVVIEPLARSKGSPA